MVEPGWLRALIAVLESDPTAGAATPQIIFADRPEVVNACGNEVHFSGITYCREYGAPVSEKSPTEVGAVSGAAFVIRKRLFEDLGGFEPTFFLYYEDTDLSLRIRCRGPQVCGGVRLPSQTCLSAILQQRQDLLPGAQPVSLAAQPGGLAGAGPDAPLAGADGAGLMGLLPPEGASRHGGEGCVPGRTCTGNGAGSRLAAGKTGTAVATNGGCQACSAPVFRFNTWTARAGS